MHLRKLIWLAGLLLVIVAVTACSRRDRTPETARQSTPLPTSTPMPTFTPTSDVVQPLIVITPPQAETPGVIIVEPGVEPQIVPPPAPTEPPTATPTPVTPTLTPTPTDTPTATATPTPTPYILVESGLTSLRTGPGVSYPLVAQLGVDLPVALVGRNPEGTWYQICCVNGESVWVARQPVRVVNDATEVRLVTAEPPPTPTITPTPTLTPTPTPFQYPFERAEGPLFFPTNNQFVTIWGKLYVGEVPDEVPAPGYFFEVEFEGFDRPGRYGAVPSADTFEFSAPPGAGNRKEYNLKYEYHPYNPPRPSYPGATPTPNALELLGRGIWTVWIKDGLGNQLSEKVEFRTDPSNPYREVYVAWRRVR